jgi:L-2-hydroxyglutarate oxidase LhgO
MENHQHGIKGAYVGGDWVNIEDCGELFNIKNGSDKTNKSNCGGDCSTCPRSRSKNTSIKNDGTYDVIIIGGGCIGSAIARELSKTTNSVLLLEAADDISQGATKGNSGIVHAGFDDTPGSNRAKFCWPGNQMFEQLDRELHFGYQKNGSLVLARSEADIDHLRELKKRGETNGVKGLRIVEKNELFQLEPHVHPDSIAGLLAPEAGNLIPYEYTIAVAENAVDNGVELRIRRVVTSIKNDISTNGFFEIKARHWEPTHYVDAMESKVKSTSSNTIFNILVPINVLGISILTKYAPILSEMYKINTINALIYGIASIFSISIVILLLIKQFDGKKNISNTPSSSVGGGGRKVSVAEMMLGGSGSETAMNGVTIENETFKSKFIVNCAGGYSDKISQMIGDNSFQIKPRIGDYFLLKREQGSLAAHTLFPCPGPLGKGVLVQTTLWGNLILGPTARDVHVPSVMAETASDIQKYILAKCKELVPSFNAKETFHGFSGARAKSTRGDWIIEASEAHPSFIHAAGIDSPGLAGSPAIAIEIVRLLNNAGLKLQPNPNFNPNRAPIITPKDGWKGIKAGKIGKFTNPNENIVCKCEKVTEAEIVTALHRSLPIDSTQAIRKRTRAGMGFCQGDPDNYDCECRVASIISRESGLPIEAVGRRPWSATTTLSERWIKDEEKDHLEKMKMSA